MSTAILACKKANPITDLPSGDGKWNYTRVNSGVVVEEGMLVFNSLGFVTWNNSNGSTTNEYFVDANSLTFKSGSNIYMYTFKEKSKKKYIFENSIELITITK